MNQVYDLNDPLMLALQEAYHMDETEIVLQLIGEAKASAAELKKIQAQARHLVTGVRKDRLSKGGLDAFLYQYDLSSDEGIVLMCLAEALLRIPDSKTVDNLIKDKITAADWEQHVGKSHSLFVNAATWGLMLTGKILKDPEHDGKALGNVFKRLANRGGEPVIRQAVAQAMKIMGKQFVMGRTIGEALKRARDNERRGYSYSYDMLGEGARTDEDAKRYYRAYQDAITAIAKVAGDRGPKAAPGISVKLSALEPRYEYAKLANLFVRLYPRVKQLALQAKKANIGFTIDAEEADRLEISLRLFEKLLADPDLSGWDGLGLALQAYQKRATFALDWLIAKARANNRRIMLRLVKGAYWDSEIKHAQVEGLASYPVFTRKIATDVSYLACVKKIFTATDVIYPQFATHNAFSLSAILEHAGGYRDFEFQCLHGMGESLYDQVVGPENFDIPCRIYAPVGSHEDLLAYLVRRLLENGANTSFVNRIVDENLPIDALIADPVNKLQMLIDKPHPKIPLPKDLYQGYRGNSQGLDLSNSLEWQPIHQQMQQFMQQDYFAKPTLAAEDRSAVVDVTSPQTGKVIGKLQRATEADLDAAMSAALAEQPHWDAQGVEHRAECLERMALLLEHNRAELMALAVLEAGKTLPDAIGEVREAIDFCWYYANLARDTASEMVLPSPTGETNSLQFHGRGVMIAISPWNFPLAIFLGQVCAALVAGNAVLAKPAEQTPLIAAKAVDLLHQAGISETIVQLIPGPGRLIGAKLVSNIETAGVLFTGSTATAQNIYQSLANRGGPIVPLIAETGGQNAMIADSSALLEQLIDDVVNSAFTSAGQRCSALRVLFVQDDIADKVITMLKGAMAEIEVGDPMQLATDVGPVIDMGALEGLEAHKARMLKEAKLIYAVEHGMEQGSYFAPVAFELESIEQLTEEVFGPCLHVIRFKGDELDQTIAAINATGYGLTLGIHSRIDETVDYIKQRVKVGNIYVNRNTIGAVVGVQPFGGEGLSGTGPKAGGPNYLSRLMVERTITTDTTAAGGNATLMNL